MNTINLTPILQALIGLLSALITYRLIPWIKARTTEAQQIQIDAAVRIAVYAAEQIFGAGHGAEKKDYAIKYLHDKGFDVDSRRIEAAVYELLNDPGLIIHDEVNVPTYKPPAAGEIDEEQFIEG